jgi:hypothetical protein
MSGEPVPSITTPIWFWKLLTQLAAIHRRERMGSIERWVWLRDDGVLMMHQENDGWRCMRRGLEARDRKISLEELKATYGKAHNYERAVQLLAERKAKQKP